MFVLRTAAVDGEPAEVVERRDIHHDRGHGDAVAVQIVDELHSRSVDVAVVVCRGECGDAADHWIETVVLAQPRTLGS